MIKRFQGRCSFLFDWLKSSTLYLSYYFNSLISSWPSAYLLSDELMLYKFNTWLNSGKVLKSKVWLIVKGKLDDKYSIKSSFSDEILKTGEVENTK